MGHDSCWFASEKYQGLLFTVKIPCQISVPFFQDGNFNWVLKKKGYFNFFPFLFLICTILKVHFWASESPLKKMKNSFYFTLKALLVLKIYKFLSWLLCLWRKTAWLERSGYFQNLWRHNLVNKQLQYTYLPISQEVKTIRQWNLVS